MELKPIFAFVLDDQDVFFDLLAKAKSDTAILFHNMIAAKVVQQKVQPTPNSTELQTKLNIELSALIKLTNSTAYFINCTLFWGRLDGDSKDSIKDKMLADAEEHISIKIKEDVHKIYPDAKIINCFFRIVK